MPTVKEENQTERNHMVTLVDGKREEVTLDEILYVKAEGIHSKIYTTKKNYEVKERFGLVTRELKEAGFVTSHHSYCLNIRYAQQLTEKECIMDDGSQVPVSRGAFKRLNDAFKNYYCSRTPVQQ